MKSIKIFFLATVAIVAGLFTACSDDDFKAGPEVDGAQVYFPENVTTQHSISDDVSSIAIPVKRIAKDEALTVGFSPATSRVCSPFRRRYRSQPARRLPNC